MTIPVGTVMMYAGDISSSSVLNLALSGWLVCDGSTYSSQSTRYAPLFAVIGQAYGGNNVSFCVPSYKGLFIRGVNGQSNRDPDVNSRGGSRPDMTNSGNTGNKVGSFESDAFENHSHSYNEYSNLRNQDHVAAHDTLNSGSTNASINNSGGNETRPTNIYVNFIIKYLPNDSQIPAGAIAPYAADIVEGGLFSSSNWMPCDGRGLNITSYFDLYNAILSYYGEDAQGHFFLPDYRGRFLRGVQGIPLTSNAMYDPDAGNRTRPRPDLPKPGNLGNMVGTVQSDDFKSHSHNYNYNDNYQWSAATLIGFHGVSHDEGTNSYQSGNNGSLTESRPTNINVNYLIKVNNL